MFCWAPIYHAFPIIGNLLQNLRSCLSKRLSSLYRKNYYSRTLNMSTWVMFLIEIFSSSPRNSRAGPFLKSILALVAGHLLITGRPTLSSSVWSTSKEITWKIWAHFYLRQLLILVIKSHTRIHKTLKNKNKTTFPSSGRARAHARADAPVKVPWRKDFEKMYVFYIQLFRVLTYY